MRKFALSLVSLLVVTYCSAQNTFPATGNAGIGTTSPAGNLHILSYDWDKITLDVPNTSGVVQQKYKNSGQVVEFGLVGSSVPTAGFQKTSSSFYYTNATNGISIAAGNFTSGAIRFYAGGTADSHERFRIDQTGKIFGYKVTKAVALSDSAVNIDPTTGEFQLAPIQAKRITFADTRAASTTPALYNTSFQTHLKSAGSIGLTSTGSGFVSVVGLRAGDANGTGKAHELAFSDGNQIMFRSGNTEGWDSWRKLVTEDNNGNVGIGTITPQAKLAVNGDVYAKKVKVTQTGWPDYVFASNYTLPSLYEVEQYIKKYKHLPGVVSASDVENDGLDLGNNQASLLQKIEELTLYAIQQQHKIDQLQIEKKEQALLLAELMKRVMELEKAR